MSARSAWVWNLAAWREAVRLREPFVDVDHLLLALLAGGGPAARVLGRHGLTLVRARRAAAAARTEALTSLGIDVTYLAPVSPRANHELDYKGAGHAPTAARAEALQKSLGRRSTEGDYLAALLAEPSGVVAQVLACAGLDVGALAREVADAAIDWRTPTPVRVASATPATPGRHVSSLRLEHWASAPAHLVRQVAGDLAGTDRWLTSPTGRPTQIVDARPGAGPGRWGSSRALGLVSETPERITWEMWWGELYGGSHTIDLRPAGGGTSMTYTREMVTFRHLGAPLMPLVRLTTGLGMHAIIQNISFACADRLEAEAA